MTSDWLWVEYCWCSVDIRTYVAALIFFRFEVALHGVPAVHSNHLTSRHVSWGLLSSYPQLFGLVDNTADARRQECVHLPHHGVDVLIRVIPP